jgi:hypothetical protein
MIKRWFLAILLAGCLMVADVLALVGVTRAFLPSQPPLWATAPFFWVLAWPVQLFTWIIPNSGANQRGGPSLSAIILGAVIDIVLLALLVDWIRRRRARGAIGFIP